MFLILQASLNKLMETLGQSEPYFVKCIRSNADKVLFALKHFAIYFEVGTTFIYFSLFPPLCDLCPSFLNLFLCLPVSQLPLRFDDNLVLRQLRYTGMLETVRIRQSGYTIKYGFKVTFSARKHPFINVI